MTTVIGSLVTASGVSIGHDAAVGGSLTVGGNVNVSGNINAQVVYVPPSTWDLHGQPIYNSSSGTIDLSAGSVIAPSRMGIGTSNLSGSAALTVSGDIVCRDLYTASSTVYIGSAKLSQSGNTFHFGGDITSIAVAGLPVSGGGWVGTAGGNLDMGSYAITSSTGTTTISGGLLVVGAEAVTSNLTTSGLTVNNRSVLTSVSASAISVASNVTVLGSSTLTNVSALALSVGGYTSLTSVSASALSVTGGTNLSNVSASGTLGVTGQTTLTSVSASALSVTGATTLSGLTSTAATTLSGLTVNNRSILSTVSASTLDVTGVTTLSGLTVNNRSVLSSVSATTLGVTGATTLSTLRMGGTIDMSGSRITDSTGTLTLSANSIVLDTAGVDLTVGGQMTAASANVTSLSATTLNVTGQTTLASVSATSLTVTNPISFANLNVTSLAATRMASAIDMSGYRITDSTGTLTLSANSIVLDSAGVDLTVNSSTLNIPASSNLNLGSNGGVTFQIQPGTATTVLATSGGASSLIDTTSNMYFATTANGAIGGMATSGTSMRFGATGSFTGAVVDATGSVTLASNLTATSGHTNLNTVSAASVFITGAPLTATYTASLASNLGVFSSNLVGIPGLCNIDITSFSRYKTIRLEFMAGNVYGNGSTAAWNIVAVGTSNISGLSTSTTHGRIVAQKFTYLDNTNGFFFNLNGTSYPSGGQSFMNNGITLPGPSTLIDYTSGAGILCVATAGGNSFIAGTSNGHQPPTIRVTGVA